MYADDTVLYATGKNVNDVQFILQDCTNYVHNWCIVNRLYMNMKKTKIMWFGVQNDKSSPSRDTIDIEGNTIERVYSYHYLGIELDSVLSLDEHLDYVVMKCNHKLYIFRMVHRFISEQTAVLIYKQTIRPLIECCSFIFHSGKKSKIDKIDKIQSKCIRIIENYKCKKLRKDVNVLCSEHNISTLQYRRDMQLGCIMYRYSNMVQRSTATYTFTYIRWLKLAAYYGSCSQ